jgi:WD40 repeat protein
LWELDIKSFRRSNAHKNILNLAKFLGGYKSYSKAVHFCEFSPSGYQLFSGSDDGIAKIWKIEKGGKMPPSLSEDKLLATLQEKMKHSKQDHETAFSGVRHLKFILFFNFRLTEKL